MKKGLIMKLQNRSLFMFIPLFTLNIIAVIFFVNNNFQKTLTSNSLNESQLLGAEIKVLQKELETKSLSIVTLVATNTEVIEAYSLGDKLAIHNSLKPIADKIMTQMNTSMDVANLRLHFHIAPARSLYRTWTDQWDDDLSSFRHTVNQVIQTGIPIMGIELGKGGMVIRGVHPIKVNNKTVGSVEMYFQPQQLMDMLKLDEKKTGMVLLADRESLLKIMFEADLDNYDLGQIGSQMISYNSAEWINPKELISEDLIEMAIKNGEPVFVTVGNNAVSYLPILDFQDSIVGFYVFIQDMSESIQVNNTTKLRLAFLLVLINFTILATLIFWIFKFVIRPIKRLDQAVEIISRGSGDLTHRITVKRNDELGAIGNNFNGFLENLTEIVSKTRTASESTENSSQELSSVSEQTMSATESITESISNSREQLTLTSREMNNSGEYSEIISNKLNDFQSNIEQLSAIVEESSAGLTEMLASLESVNKVVQDRQKLTEELVDLSLDGERSIGETNDQINSIKESVEQIQAFTTMIDEIATQTNLLSMNAAIEAAHAGEAGKGFAVVAGEIRKLAETSSTESRQIGESIKKITGTILKTEESGKSSKEAFSRIAESVKNVAEGLYGIASSTSELTMGSKEVMKAILEVKNVTIDVKDSSTEIREQQIKLNNVVGQSIKAIEKLQLIETEMSDRSGEIELSMKNLIHVVEELNLDSRELKEEIKRFKLD
jgi:methyl-accepting chemotaxis protein